MERPALACYDFVVVGAGSAGCVLAGRLARALPEARIALLEDGTDASSRSDVFEPARWPRNLGSEIDYGYRTAQQPSLGGRRLLYSRGRGFGGSSLINAMLYNRGPKKFWDALPEGWRSGDVAPAFASLEEQLGMTVVVPGALGESVRKAAEGIGIGSAVKDAWAAPGVATSFTATIDPSTGRRLDIYKLFGAASSGNVTVVRCRAERVVFDSEQRAVGVAVCGSSGERWTIAVSVVGEIILCAGAVDTPRCLQLSGVGPAKLLERLGIPRASDLPVGEGLVDQPLLPCMHWWRGPNDRARLSPNSIQAWIRDEDAGINVDVVDGNCVAAILPWAMLLPFQRPGRFWDCVQVLVGLVAAILSFLLRVLPSLDTLCTRAVGLNLAVLNPTSLGSVFITSRDPAAPPVVDPGFLTSEEDVRTMLRGLARVRQLAATAPLSSALALEMLPGILSDRMHLKLFTSTYYHPTSTCRMGQCLDSELRVIGVRCLRVCDASALPAHPQVPTAAACMVLGARCAELLASEWRARGSRGPAS